MAVQFLYTFLTIATAFLFLQVWDVHLRGMEVPTWVNLIYLYSVVGAVFSAIWAVWSWNE